MFPQIPVTQHVKAQIVCKGELKLLGGDGEDGEGMDDPFYMECLKCGETNFFNEKSSRKGCPMILVTKKYSK